MSTSTLTTTPPDAAPRATARTTSVGIFIVLLAQLMLVLDSAVMNV